MATSTAKSSTATHIEPFIISRTFDAPRDRVWKAWTNPQDMAQWWGPKGAKAEIKKLDVKPGGVGHYSMQTPMGHIWGKFVYREIKAPERLVWVNSFSDENEGITRHPMSPTWPAQMLTTVTFEDVGGKTKVTINWMPLDATEVELQTFDEGRDSMNQGWGGSLDVLGEYLQRA